MVKGKTIAIIGAGASIVGLLAVGLSQGKQTTTTTPPAQYSLTLTTTQPSAPANTKVPYTATLLKNGTPVAGQQVTLTDITTGTTSSTNTNVSGVADFDVTFPTPGTYDLEATADV